MRIIIQNVMLGLIAAVVYGLVGCGGGGGDSGGGNQSTGNATISGKVSVLGSNVDLTGATVTACYQPISPANAPCQPAGTAKISGQGQPNGIFYIWNYTIENLYSGSGYHITLNIPTSVNHSSYPVVASYCMQFLGTEAIVTAPEQAISFSCDSGLHFNDCSSSGNQCP